MKKITELKKPSKELIECALLVFKAIAYTETIRPVVEKYQKEILAKHQFTVSDKWVKMGEPKRVILDEGSTYLLKDKDFKVYLKEVHEQHIKHGFNVKFEYCPLLIAEDLERQAKKTFVDQSKEFNIMDDETFDCLTWDLKNYKKYIEITLSYVAQFINKKDIEKVKSELN